MGLLIVMSVPVGRRRKKVEFFTESAGTNVDALLQRLREAVPCRKKGKQYAFELHAPSRDKPLCKDEVLTDLFPLGGSVRLRVSLFIKDADATDSAAEGASPTPSTAHTRNAPVRATPHSRRDAHGNNEMPSPAATFDGGFNAPTLATPSTNEMAELQGHAGPDESDTQGHSPANTKTSDASPQAPTTPGAGVSVDMETDDVDGRDNNATADPNADAANILSVAELQDQIEKCEALGDAVAADTLREELALLWMKEEIRILQAQQEAIEKYSDDYMLDDDLFAKHTALAHAIEAQEGEVLELVAKRAEAKHSLEDTSSRICSAGTSNTLLAEAQRARAVVKGPQQLVRNYIDQCQAKFSTAQKRLEEISQIEQEFAQLRQQLHCRQGDRNALATKSAQLRKRHKHLLVDGEDVQPDREHKPVERRLDADLKDSDVHSQNADEESDGPDVDLMASPITISREKSVQPHSTIAKAVHRGTDVRLSEWRYLISLLCCDLLAGVARRGGRCHTTPRSATLFEF